MSIAKRLETIQAAITAAAVKYQRAPDAISLLAVSKRQTIQAIETAFQHGQLDFAENHVQEALGKMQEIKHPEIIWHFIGSIQSNKTKNIATHFQWVHSIDQYKIAERLNKQRPAHLPPLNVCLQINIDDEASKSGFKAAEILDVAKRIADLEHLKLRGLMCIPKPQTDPDKQRQPFAKLNALFKMLNRSGLQLDTLSMGMTADFDAAIAEGSTIVRIGTGIFGARLKGNTTSPH